MPDIKKNLEQNLEKINQPEISTPSPESKEDFLRPEKNKEIESTPVLDQEDDLPDASQSSTTPPAVAPNPVSERLKEEIDDILEEGLEGLYLNMSKEKQEEFKIKGEETTKEIVGLLGQAKVKVKKILQAIIEWLKMISGVNKFFIKQTAKIKTDKILDLKEKELSEE